MQAVKGGGVANFMNIFFECVQHLDENEEAQSHSASEDLIEFAMTSRSKDTVNWDKTDLYVPIY